MRRLLRVAALSAMMFSLFIFLGTVVEQRAEVETNKTALSTESRPAAADPTWEVQGWLCHFLFDLLPADDSCQHYRDAHCRSASPSGQSPGRWSSCRAIHVVQKMTISEDRPLLTQAMALGRP